MTDLRALVPAHRAIVERVSAMFPEEDQDTLADSIAGMSDLPDAIVAVLRAALEREAQAKAIKDELIARLLYRAHRLEDGARTMRAAALQAMIEGNLPKIRAIDMSLSVGHGKARVQITDPALIPDELCKFTREPSKTLIGEALQKGDVPGACYSNAAAFLTVHRS
jgi:flagellar motor switch protein FliG